MKEPTITLGKVDLFLVRDGTKVRAHMALIDEETGNGGSFTVYVDPSDSITEIKERIGIEARAMFDRASRAKVT